MRNPGGLCPFALLAAVAVTVLGPVPAYAASQVPTSMKQTYFAPDPMAPELANSYLETHPGHAIEIISFMQAGKDTSEVYYDYGPLTRTARGVCQFLATQVFPHRADGMISWDSKPESPRDRVEPPFTMAAIAPAPCPKQSEDDYVTLDNGITDQDFVAISNFWRDVTKSEMKFDDASVYLSLIISSRQADKFTLFREAALKAGSQMQLRAVFRAGVDNYDLAFSETSVDSPNSFVSISKSATGFQMVNFQSQF